MWSFYLKNIYNNNKKKWSYFAIIEFEKIYVYMNILIKNMGNILLNLSIAEIT